MLSRIPQSGHTVARPGAPTHGSDLFGAAPARRVAAEDARREGWRSRGAAPVQAHDAVLALDIETVPDDLVPPDWPPDRFPKNAWHRVVAVSFIEAAIVRTPGEEREAYEVTACRSGGEAGWDEARLLRAFWRFFSGKRYRVVTWNGRSFDMPTLLVRSMMHGIDASAWYRRGTRWEGYASRFAPDWHADLMDVLSEYGASARLTLEEAAALLGLPGKMGEHGSQVADMIARGEAERVRAYCETDCLNLMVLYLRWALLTGRTDATAHDRSVAGLVRYLDAERAERPHLGRFLDAWRPASNSRPAFVAMPATGVRETKSL
ncbi:3'-5' exonuclease [Methylobacterium soli]|uniref:3'-5' exonuclease n=1 Tax=Methylobacterium soli TaxID=553447 RepID=A0A6L3T5J4_9HYPH|nr:3'-5' exonuclease [Methylobacterium soli]KAB1080549.1 3'-5' exonuclease [Methylobacterium soli]